VVYPRRSIIYAEQQASVFLKLVQVHEPPVPVEELALETDLVRHIINDSTQIALGKSTLRANGDWVVTLNTSRAEDQRSFITAHEVKHILDYQFVDVLYPPVPSSRLPVDGRHGQLLRLVPHRAEVLAGDVRTPRHW